MSRKPIEGDLEVNKLCLKIAFDDELDWLGIKDDDVPDFSGDIDEAWRVVRGMRPSRLELHAYGYGADVRFDGQEQYVRGNPAMAICMAALMTYTENIDELIKRLTSNHLIEKAESPI